MEDRLLGIVYGNEFFHEFDPTVPTVEWYKFNFIRGYISRISVGRTDRARQHRSIFELNNEFWKNFSKENQTLYNNTYNSMIQNIKTEDIQEYYKNSNFGKLAKMIDADTKN